MVLYLVLVILVTAGWKPKTFYDSLKDYDSSIYLFLPSTNVSLISAMYTGLNNGPLLRKIILR